MVSGFQACSFAAHAVGILAAHVERVPQDRHVGEGKPVALGGFARDLVEAHAFNGGVRAREPLGEEIGLEAHRVEDLGAAIGLIGGDAHLGHHLHEPLADGLYVAVEGFVLANGLFEIAKVGFDGFEGEIGVDRLRAIAGQNRELVDLVRLAGFDDNADRGAQALADQVMMDRAGGEQARDRDAVRTHFAVGQHDDVPALQHHRFGAAAQPVERALHPCGAQMRAVGHVERDRAERRERHLRNLADALQVLVGEDRLADLKPLLFPGAFEVEDVGARADERDEAHHQLLADRIDRRVRDLREVLLEIGVQRLRFGGKRRDRRVRAHRADGFLAGLDHGREQEFPAFLGVAEGLLAVDERDFAAGLRWLGGRQGFHADLAVVQPFLIRAGIGEFRLDLVVGDDPALFEVDQQHLAGLQPPFADDHLLRHGQYAASEARITRPSEVMK